MWNLEVGAWRTKSAAKRTPEITDRVVRRSREVLMSCVEGVDDGTTTARK